MDLRHLRYFTAVAEERHFGRAAQRLGIAQPPLSRQIQDLESELGFSLFDRSRRRVELTPAGVVFLAHVRRVFDALDLAVHEARRASVGETGRLVVGYLSSLAYSGITELVRAFRTDFPSVELALREMPPQEQIEALKDGRIDVGFVRAPLNDPRLASECVRREPLLVALPADHPLAGRRRIPLELLSREPFVVFPRQRGSAFFDLVVGLCREAGFTPRIVQEALHLDILSLVAAGFGVSILPESIKNIRRGGLALRPIVGAPVTDLLLAWRADDASPTLGQFLSFVRRVGVSKSKPSAARRAPGEGERDPGAHGAGPGVEG
ncbi:MULTISPECIES: LysR substrate-binding domain-containing protein [Sorangium]|uniref:LysR family transcriptional regulator n=1 Tax=Sorangium cellulosum TaxID=56 RepID=A0A4P2QIM6_SORCE|nr:MULTISPECIES: LysR substrate-binding domain-containing protein [Sorangium]AUX29857.1 LysR family transcriptional regulator [Sorangium cellulosum]WCQ89245.1 HTH-type transcriptional regulator BenM [Sorangium sp. Soce836]